MQSAVGPETLSHIALSVLKLNKQPAVESLGLSRTVLTLTFSAELIIGHKVSYKFIFTACFSAFLTRERGVELL